MADELNCPEQSRDASMELINDFAQNNRFEFFNSLFWHWDDGAWIWKSDWVKLVLNVIETFIVHCNIIFLLLL